MRGVDSLSIERHLGAITLRGEMCWRWVFPYEGRARLTYQSFTLFRF